MKKKLIFFVLYLVLFCYLFSEEMIFTLNGEREKKDSNEENSLYSGIELLPNSTVFSTDDLNCIFGQYSIHDNGNAVPQDWPLKYSDKIKVYNMSYDEDIDIDFYGYNEKTENWDLAGNCSIQLDKGMNNSDGIVCEIDEPFDSVKKAKLKNYKIFSAVSKNEHLYEFKFRANQNDLYIYITKRLDNISENYKNNTYLINLEELGEVVSTSIKINNDTNKPLTFVIYGYGNIEDKDWDRIWTMKIKKNDDAELRGPYYGQLSKYRYFAVKNKENIDVQYSIDFSGKKIIITAK